MERNLRIPVGTLVAIKGLGYPVVIVGHEMWKEKEAKRYNYIGVRYPIGFVSEQELIYINHNRIEDILDLGVLHPEHIELSDALDMELKVGIYEESDNSNEVEDKDDDFILI